MGQPLCFVGALILRERIHRDSHARRRWIARPRVPYLDEQAGTSPAGNPDVADHVRHRLANPRKVDKLRKQRNLTEYTGDLVPESAVVECLAQAKTLQAGQTSSRWNTAAFLGLIGVRRYTLFLPYRCGCV